MKRTLVAVGDVTDPNTWSGTPYHYWQAGKKAGFITSPATLDLKRISWQRYVWNAERILSGRKAGGFQYSHWFSRILESQIQNGCEADEYLSFNQFLPTASFASNRGTKCSYYIDATMTDLLKSYKLGDTMAASTAQRALRKERENLEAAERVIGFQRWAANSILHDYGISPDKVKTILPGANLVLPDGFSFSDMRPGAGIDHPLRLCFIGKDWERKGLPLLAEVRSSLERRGLNVILCVIGGCPESLKDQPGIDYKGFINKNLEMEKFIDVVKSCDMGCLFSTADASSIAVLEFLRLGLPVAGFVVDGMGDLLPPDATLRFNPSCGAEEITDRIESLILNQEQLHELRQNARLWSPLVSWERCIREFQELWATSVIQNPVRPWLGLSQHSKLLA